jgi:hypothetical protein
MRPAIATSTLAFSALFWSCSALAGNTYKVTAEIIQSGKQIASPTIVVKSGAPAVMKISGDNGYEFAVEVMSAEEDTVDVTAKVRTAKGEFSTKLNGKMETPMTVSTGDIGLKITVRPQGG